MARAPSGLGITIVTKKIIDKDNNRTIVEQKIVKVNNDGTSREIKKEELKEIMNNYDIKIIGKEKEEGKLALQKYINEK